MSTPETIEEMRRRREYTEKQMKICADVSVVMLVQTPMLDLAMMTFRNIR